LRTSGANGYLGRAVSGRLFLPSIIGGDVIRMAVGFCAEVRVPPAVLAGKCGGSFFLDVGGPQADAGGG